MNDIVKTIRIQHTPFKQLTLDEQELMQRALDVRTHAQAPYSQFSVGVALLTHKETMHVGCNVERCSYTQTTHAEQSAVDAMVAQIGSAQIKKLAVVAAPQSAEISIDAVPRASGFPCGHCLQIIWENCAADQTVKILSLGMHGIVAVATIGDLLPFPFGPENLGITYT